jgi:hypothetical protein
LIGRFCEDDPAGRVAGCVLGSVHFEALPYRNVDLKKFYPYGEPVFPA